MAKQQKPITKTVVKAVAKSTPKPVVKVAVKTVSKPVPILRVKEVSDSLKNNYNSKDSLRAKQLDKNISNAVSKAKPVPITRVKQIADSLNKTGKPNDVKRATQLNQKVSTAVKNRPTPDSTKVFNNKYESGRNSRDAWTNANIAAKKDPQKDIRVTSAQDYMIKAADNRDRQANKGKPGYDRNGYPKK